MGNCTTQRTLRECEPFYIRLPVPKEGFTLFVDTIGAEVGVYGSFTEQNPNPLTADFETRGQGRMSIAINHQDEARNDAVYLNVVSLEGNSSVNITSNFGDKAEFGK